jgi:predicted XRE-type DNA-binding protein
MKAPKILTERPKNWPSEVELRRMDKILEKAKGSRGLPPNATLLDRFKWDLCAEFVRYCHEHDFTQRELAKKLHISESRISEIVHYHIDKITLDRLTKYLDVLKPKAKIKIASGE